MKSHKTRNFLIKHERNKLTKYYKTCTTVKIVKKIIKLQVK